MKTIVIECKFTIEVPWDEAWGDVDTQTFRIEENSCPGTGPVDGVLRPLMERCAEASVCWACNLGGTNRIVETLDREPRKYDEMLKDA